MRPVASERGVTVVELTLAVTVLTVIVGVGVAAATHSLQVASDANAIAEAREQAARMHIRIADLLREASVEPAGGVLLSNAAPPVERTNALVWNRVLGYDATNDERIYGNPRQLRFEYDPAEVADDGLDNDGDGFVDEGRLVFIRDTVAGSRPEVLGDNIKNDATFALPAGGLSPGLNEFLLSVSYKVMFKDQRGAVGEVPVSITVAFRNGRSL